MQENFTSQKRLERIAQIINKGIYLLAQKEGWLAHCSEKKIKNKRALSQRQDAIMENLRSKGKIKNKEVCELLGVSRDTAHRELKKLISIGLLEVKGKGRMVTYFEK